MINRKNFAHSNSPEQVKLRQSQFLVKNVPFYMHRRRRLLGDHYRTKRNVLFNLPLKLMQLILRKPKNI